MLHKLVRPADILEFTETTLSNDSARLPASSRETMRSGAIAGWKNLSRYNEYCHVGAEILHEISKAVEEDKRLGVGC